MLHAHLQTIQTLMDDLEGTNVYSHKIKRDCKSLQASLAPHLKKWFEYHLETSGERQVDYLELSNQLETALHAVMNCNPHLLQSVPSVLAEMQNFVNTNPDHV